MAETGTVYNLDFMCRCSPEEIAKCVALREEVIELLNRDSGSSMRLPIDASNLLTYLSWDMHWEFDAHVTGIDADQWFGIFAQSYDKTFDCFVQCDFVEDGFIAIWKIFYDRK